MKIENPVLSMKSREELDVREKGGIGSR
jgi:hypothetical protein